MGLFRRKKKIEEELPEQKIEQTEDEATDGVKTSLIFHEDWDVATPERYVFQYHHQQLPLLKPNQISISGISLQQFGDDFFVTAFLRNTLTKSVSFETVDLLLLDENNKPFAKKSFDMFELVEIPAMSSIPWRFLFEKDARLSEHIPSKDEKWRIAFELKSNTNAKPHQLELASSWENQISPVQREQLEKLVAGLPKLSPGEVNFLGIEAKFVEDHALAVTVLIRNGSPKNIQLEQIPLVVEDAEGDLVCQGGFKLENFEVSANTSKPWTFIFPAQLILKAEPNLTSWKVSPPAQQKQAI